MNPSDTKSLTARVDQVAQSVEKMRRGRDVEFLETLKLRALEGAILAGTQDDPTTINQSVAGNAAFDAPKAYDKKVRVEIDGSFYYIGLHNA